MFPRSQGSRPGTRHGNRLTRNSDDLCDLTSSIGRLTVGTTAQVQVPRLTSFLRGGALTNKGPSPRAIPENYSSESAYLEDMKAHTQCEFEASIRQGAIEASSRQTSGWLAASCNVREHADKTLEVSFFVSGTPDESKAVIGHDFEVEPWSRHAIQFEGNSVPTLVLVCKTGHTKNNAILKIPSARGLGGGVPPSWLESSQTRVRSLGYVGSFLREYCSAAELLSGMRHSTLLGVVAAPAKLRSSPAGGTFLWADDRSLDTASVPLNATQRNAVLNLTGGLDIIVGPPGTGKSTTIWHVINARVAPEARVLVTCTRNQAVDAVTEKLESFGILVFGSEARLGENAKRYTIGGRMFHDRELVFWQRLLATWESVLGDANGVSWSRLHLPNFPGIGRLKEVENKCVQTPSYYVSKGKYNLTEEEHRKGLTAGRWARVLEHALHVGWKKWLKNGGQKQRQTYEQMRLLRKYKELLSTGTERVKDMLTRLKNLTLFRFYTETRVLICTVDSAEGMVRTMEEGTVGAALAVGGSAQSTSGELTVDTAIVDEAACVLETSMPVLLALGVNNLTLVGDHKQLQPFSLVRDGEGGRNHSRSLMERALVAGAPRQFLTTQYRMHPRICEVISKCFYDNEVVTAEQVRLNRTSSQPCKWVHVSGGEVKHEGKGYSNPLEVPMVVQQARSARRRYGPNADIRVITFYNKQKRYLELEFKKNHDISHVRIASVDSCQGSDADVIIISTVRSGRTGYKLSGFMLDPRRVNVALSRAKEECIIVGDKNTLWSGGGAMWRSVVSHYTS